MSQKIPLPGETVFVVQIAAMIIFTLYVATVPSTAPSTIELLLLPRSFAFGNLLVPNGEMENPVQYMPVIRNDIHANEVEPLHDAEEREDPANPQQAGNRREAVEDEVGDAEENNDDI